MAATKVKNLSALHLASKELLEKEWESVLSIQPESLQQLRDPEWGPLFESLITDGGSTYPYVLLGQVLAKSADGSVNALCLQDSSPLEGARDVRMLVKNVVVPWNVAVGRPFPGANSDPYVNNPARYKNFGEEMASKAGNRSQYDQLFKIVQHIEDQGQQEALRFLRLILTETRVALETNKRTYVGPSRASLEDVAHVLREFLHERSNGVCLQVVCYAVLRAFAIAFPNFGVVRSYSTNSSDAAGDRAGDVERLTDGKVDFAIEVKDRTLTLTDVETSITKARIADVNNLLFVVQASPLLDDPDAILNRATHEFVRGIDVNFSEAIRFIHGVLLLLSPEQRADLLRLVHDALHELGAPYKHVHRWTDLMKTI